MDGIDEGLGKECDGGIDEMPWVRVPPPPLTNPTKNQTLPSNWGGGCKKQPSTWDAHVYPKRAALEDGCVIGPRRF